ncbi:hypothetical protein EXS71_02830 [Candidatus Uhrbacteria bacterium]|nr:hypothetical protein [Candidatus Uhrbacteria bacterium]
MKFRVICTTRNSLGEGPTRVTTNIVWEGTDTHALSEEHPPSNVRGADNLASGSIEDAWITWDHHFEQEIDGQWVICKDPRVRLFNQGQSDLEAAIEEENHRLFPGDYFDSAAFALERDIELGYCPPHLADDDPAHFEDEE